MAYKEALSSLSSGIASNMNGSNRDVSWAQSLLIHDTKGAWSPNSGIRILYFLFLCLPVLAQAQTVPITPSGLNTQVSAPIITGSGATQHNITGGTRPGGGGNVFHSFGEFNVPTNNIANFLNDSALPTSNILGRVTGGNVSSILGMIQTTGFGAANVFMMNPAGFLFGPNATINVGGMMAFTTADYLKLADGVRFNAIPNAAADALLSAAPVAAFGFLGSNPAAINFEGGQLTVTNGTGLALVGGNISLVPDSSGTPSSITAPGRPIQMTSVAGPGEVVADSGITTAGMVLGTVSLGQGTILSTASDLLFGDSGGGSITIRGGQFVAAGATMLTNPAFGSTGQGAAVTIAATGPASIADSFIDTHSDAANGGGGDVSVSASDLTLERTTIMTGVFGDGITPVAGSGGAMSLSATTGSLSLTDSALDTSGFFAAGGGAVNLTGTESVVLTRSTVHTDVISPISNGNSGTAIVAAPVISLEDSFISTQFVGDGLTQVTGNSGAITMTGTTSISLLRSSLATDSFETQGNSGAVSITAPAVTIVGDPSNPSINISTGTHNFSGDPNAGSGGNITITASEQNVSLDSARLESTAEGFGLTQQGGSIEISAPQSILIQNGSSFRTSTDGTGSAGTIELMGHNVTIRGQSVLASSTFGSGNAGTVKITGKNTVALESGSTIFTTAEFDKGPAGHIEINTPQLTIIEGSRLRSNSASSGQGGIVTVQGISSPAQSVLIDGFDSGIFTTATDSGAGGGINISAQSLALQNDGTLSAATSGSMPSATGGVITVNANTVNLNTGGTMTAASTGAGAAGDITVQGHGGPADTLLISGKDENFNPSGIFTDTSGTGAGGNIFVNANSVTLQNGGTLSAKTSGIEVSASGGTIMVNANQIQVNSGGLVTASTTGSGAGGSANIIANSTFNSNAGTVSSTATQATGGDINISAGQSVTLDNGSMITANSSGEGNAGNIEINAGQQYTSTNSSVTTKAEKASGGNITVLATGLVHLTNSEINASVEGSTTTVGGNILVDPVYVILENSQILAQATQGQGGNINIFYTGALLADPSTVISASSQFGQSGTVTIQSPISPASGKIIPLGQRPLVATALLSQRCAALAGGSISSFTVAGRDSLPAEPGGWLSSPVALSAPESEDGTVREANGTMSEETPLLSVRKIAPPGFLTQTFAVGSSDCQS
jgi:filamentous hemagglutinin family protein